MSYTIEQIDEAIEETGWENPKYPEDSEFGWDAFEFEGARSGTWAKDSAGKLKRDDDGDLIWEYTQTLEEAGVVLPGIGRAAVLETFGGEGQGDSYWLVFQVTDEDGNVQIFKRNGWYASYNGGYYDGPTLAVKPVEKTITVWEEVK